MSRQDEPRRGSLSVSERAYRRLLALAPRDFRDSYGPELEQSFGDLYREERHRGAPGLTKLWIRTFPDLALTVAAENLKPVDRNQHPWRERIGGMDVVIAFALSLVLTFVALSTSFSFFAADAVPLEQLSDGLLTNLMILVSFAVSLPAIFSVALVLRVDATKVTAASIGLRRTSVRWLVIGAVAGTSCWVLGNAISTLYYWIFGSTLYLLQKEQVSALAQATMLQHALFGAGWLLTALAAHLLLMGVMYTYLRRWGVKVAMVVGAVIFSLFAFGPNPAFFVGAGAWMLFATLYERSGSLWPALTAQGVATLLGLSIGGLVL